MSPPADEIVQIVNHDNKTVNAVPRSIMRKQRLIHRATYIVVLNRHGEILIQKRTPAKDIYPGYWDLAAGGVVLKGENYGEAAVRELYEELGIRSNDLTFQFDQYYEDENNRVWGRVYTCHHEGPFTLQKEEIEKTLFVSPEKIFQLNETEPFTPDSIPILKKLLSKK